MYNLNSGFKSIFWWVNVEVRQHAFDFRPGNSLELKFNKSSCLNEFISMTKYEV